MAGYLSMLKLKGTLHDLTFYTYRGKPVVRAKTNLDRNRVMKSPEFNNSRKAMREFGAASAVGKILRDALGDFRKTHCEGQTVNRLNSNLLKIIQSHSGEKGFRPLSFSGREQMLRSFEMSETEKFGKRYKATLGLHYNLLGDHLQVRFGLFRPDEHLNSPAGATHFQLQALLVALSDYQMDEQAGKYLPLHPSLNGKSLLLSSEWKKLGPEQIRLNLETELTGPFSSQKGMSLVVLGILSFGSGTEKEIIPIREGASMAVLDVKTA